jgi:hypothetical protein
METEALSFYKEAAERTSRAAGKKMVLSIVHYFHCQVDRTFLIGRQNEPQEDDYSRQGGKKAAKRRSRRSF